MSTFKLMKKIHKDKKKWIMHKTHVYVQSYSEELHEKHAIEICERE